MKLHPILQGVVSGLEHFVYPARCQICGYMLHEGDNEYVCSTCISELPRTGFEKYRGNAIEQKFWGKICLQSAFSGFYFRRGERLRKIIHSFKYLGRKDVAVYMGRILGKMMMRSGFNRDYDFLIPVPLHPSKMRKRGYNQTTQLAIGISEVTGLEVREDVLFRVEKGISQTKKRREQRWLSIQTTYECRNADRYVGARLLVVDDVLTTGSTIEVCCNALYHIPGVVLGVVTLATAESR